MMWAETFPGKFCESLHYVSLLGENSPNMFFALYSLFPNSQGENVRSIETLIELPRQGDSVVRRLDFRDASLRWVEDSQRWYTGVIEKDSRYLVTPDSFYNEIPEVELSLVERYWLAKTIELDAGRFLKEYIEPLRKRKKRKTIVEHTAHHGRGILLS